MKLSCGVLVYREGRILLGHVTNHWWWDVPKGCKDKGETPIQAAIRELREETDIDAPAEALIDLGEHKYEPGKNLYLFKYRIPEVPEYLKCHSIVRGRGFDPFPEIDDYYWFPFADINEDICIPNMLRVLVPLLSKL